MENNLVYVDNSIFTTKPHIYLNLNTTITKNLNVNNLTNLHNLNVSNYSYFNKNVNIEGSNIVYNNIIGYNSLHISKDSSFQSNLTVYGNFSVLGSSFNILSEQTLVADPLVIYGSNPIGTSDNSYGGFVINYKKDGVNKYSGLVRYPSTNNFYLHSGISSSKSDSITPNLQSLDNDNDYANLYLNNINTSNIINPTGKIITKDISVTNNINVSNDVRISGNLIVTGNNAIVITNHFDINDPIFTIANNLSGYDRGMLLNIGNKNQHDPDLYSGLIRKDNDSNFYLLTNITNPLNETVSTTHKSTLILNNINTSNTSHINGMKFYETVNNTANKNMIAVFPNNSSSKYIIFNKNTQFNKTTQFNKNIYVNSNINLDGNLTINNKLMLINTHSLISYGTTELLGNTTITGGLNIKKSIINCDHINIRALFNNLGTTRTKTLDVDNVNIVDKLKFPIRTTSDIQNFPNNKKGYVIFNKDKNIYEGHDGTNWIPFGLDPTSTVDTYMNSTLTINKNLIVHGNTTCKHGLVIPKTPNEYYNEIAILKEAGSIYYNTTSNLFYGHNNTTWLPLGGLNPFTDTTIEHNLNVNKKITTNTLNVKGLSHFDGLVYVNNKLTSKQLIIPALTTNIDTTNNIDTGSLYINYNGAHSQLKLRLNNQDNIIPFNNNPIIQLTSSTDLFQFYNVQKNQPIYGNRITGLNDPAFNSFTKFYTLQEYTFFQETTLTDIEFYVSHSINNPNPTDLVFNLDIIRTRSSNISTPPVFTGEFTVKVATVSFQKFSSFKNNTFLENDNDKFIQNDKIKLKLTMNNDSNNYNGHEIFIRLHGHAKIYPNVDKLHILDTTNAIGDTVPALLVEGGGEFKKFIKAQNIGDFTGSHEATLISPMIYDNNYSYYHNNRYNFKAGLIVSVANSTYININNSKFNIILTNKQADTTVFGVIQSYVNNHIYMINSLGEGAIWISNINGYVNNGDYIMTSNITGYGCKQSDDILHSYTVAKCCSIINWNSINSYINHYNNNYKIAFVACTYHCG